MSIGSDPVAEGSQRRIARVTEVAVIAANADFAATPGSLTFGAQRTGPLQALLRFQPVWRNQGKIDQAFLLLEPLPKGRASAASVTVDVFRIDHAWSGTSVTWLAQPALGFPKASGIAHSNGAPLRIDVTHLIRHLQQHPAHDHGLALRASDHDGTGVSYATGVTGGIAPRIEIYTR